LNQKLSRYYTYKYNNLWYNLAGGDKDEPIYKPLSGAGVFKK
jgi:hypothetical protein